MTIPPRRMSRMPRHIRRPENEEADDATEGLHAGSLLGGDLGGGGFGGAGFSGGNGREELERARVRSDRGITHASLTDAASARQAEAERCFKQQARTLATDLAAFTMQIAMSSALRRSGATGLRSRVQPRDFPAATQRQTQLATTSLQLAAFVRSSLAAIMTARYGAVVQVHPAAIATPPSAPGTR